MDFIKNEKKGEIGYYFGEQRFSNFIMNVINDSFNMLSVALINNSKTTLSVTIPKSIKFEDFETKILPLGNYVFRELISETEFQSILQKEILEFKSR